MARPVAFNSLALALALSYMPACRDFPSPAQSNELPFGVIDTPTANQMVGRVVDVSGWAMDDSRVLYVWGYVDGRYQATATLDTPRPDVSRSVPAYAHGTDIHGWRLRLDLGETPGTHTIVVQAVDDEHATRDLGTVSVSLIDRN